MNESLIDKVLIQIQNDLEAGDLTALEELLKFIPEDKLIGFLPETGLTVFYPFND